jgi:hypothetical protein
MKYMIQTAVCMSMMAVATVAAAEEFSSTPKPETMAQAIQFEKHKDAAAEAQAKKDATEQARASRPVQTKAATKSSSSTRKEGQADNAAPRK